MRYGDNVMMAEFELAIYRKGLWDMCRLNDDEITNLCVSIEAENDVLKRREICDEILQKVDDYYSFIPCFFQNSNVAYNKNLNIPGADSLNIYRFNEFSWK